MTSQLFRITLTVFLIFVTVYITIYEFPGSTVLPPAPVTVLPPEPVFKHPRNSTNAETKISDRRMTSKSQVFKHSDIGQNVTNSTNAETKISNRRMTSQSQETTSKPWKRDTKDEACSKALDLDIPHSFLDRFINPCWYGNNSRLNCLPYYFLAGFPKCGTTDLHFKIALHPSIVQPRVKETHWWARRRFEGLDCSSLSCDGKQTYPFKRYLDNFIPARDSIETQDKRHNYSVAQRLPIIIGDSSSTTMWENRNWELLPGNENLTEPRILLAHHIRYYLPGAKIIIILRNPVDRIFSSYLYFGDENKTAQDFHTEAQNSVEDFEHCRGSRSIRTCAYRTQNWRLAIGMYSVFIKEWLKIYPREQLHILRTEDFDKEPVTQLNKIFWFLGLDSLPSDVAGEIENMSKENTRKKETASVEMLSQTQTLLSQFYRPFNEDLAKITNDKRYLWRDS